MIFSNTTGSRVTSSTIRSGSGWTSHVRRIADESSAGVPLSKRRGSPTGSQPVERMFCVTAYSRSANR
eukprot:4741713-Prymnesium_polylepis.1